MILCQRTHLKIQQIQRILLIPSFDPEGYVIGGGVSRAGEILIEQIKKSYEKYIYLVPEAAEIVQAELGNDAGITGACMLAITAWKEKGEKSC